MVQRRQNTIGGITCLKALTIDAIEDSVIIQNDSGIDKNQEMLISDKNTNITIEWELTSD